MSYSERMKIISSLFFELNPSREVLLFESGILFCVEILEVISGDDDMIEIHLGNKTDFYGIVKGGYRIIDYCNFENQLIKDFNISGRAHLFVLGEKSIQLLYVNCTLLLDEDIVKKFKDRNLRVQDIALNFS